MIKGKYYYDDDFSIKGFCLRGHADYAEIGYDIVCSAVTSNAIAVIISLDKLVKVEFEKVLGKDNWRDSTIQTILENEIYKGDFVHGKRTKSPTYYENVVEPIISKEMWEDCQVQKKKNSRSYQRTLIYLYLQKIKCPKCKRILGGKATTKKNGNSYFYYYCNDCKISIKESIIEIDKIKDVE